MREASGAATREVSANAPKVMSDHPGAPGASDGPVRSDSTLSHASSTVAIGPVARAVLVRQCPTRPGGRIDAEVRVARRHLLPRRLEGSAVERPHPADRQPSPRGGCPDRRHPQNASRRPRCLPPPMAFAMPLGRQTRWAITASASWEARAIAPEMNRRIRAAHGFGDTPPFDAPSSRMSPGGLLAKAVQRQSGCQSCGSGSAPEVAWSRRATRQRQPTPLRVDASRPDTQTGLRPFLRPHEPVPTCPLGQPASRQRSRRWRHFTGGIACLPREGSSAWIA
jgi:hypothetical protein